MWNPRLPYARKSSLPMASASMTSLPTTPSSTTVARSWPYASANRGAAMTPAATKGYSSPTATTLSTQCHSHELTSCRASFWSSQGLRSRANKAAAQIRMCAVPKQSGSAFVSVADSPAPRASSSSVMTMKTGIERRLMESIPEIVAVEPIADEETGLPLTKKTLRSQN